MTVTILNIVGGIASGSTLAYLGYTFAKADPASTTKRIQVALVLLLLWLIFTVNVCQYMPGILLEFLDSHSLIISSLYRVLFTTILCVLGLVMQQRLYIKYILTPKTIMQAQKTGEFIPSSQGQTMRERFQKAFPEFPHGFFFHKSKVQPVIDTEGSEYIHIDFGLNDEDKVSPLVYPSDVNGDRIPMKMKERGLMRTATSDDDDDDDYLLDKGGATPPGTKG